MRKHNGCGFSERNTSVINHFTNQKVQTLGNHSLKAYRSLSHPAQCSNRKNAAATQRGFACPGTRMHSYDKCILSELGQTAKNMPGFPLSYRIVHSDVLFPYLQKYIFFLYRRNCNRTGNDLRKKNHGIDIHIKVIGDIRRKRFLFFKQSTHLTFTQHLDIYYMIYVLLK